MSKESLRASAIALFEKLAWPYDPSTVAAQAAAAGKPHVAEAVNRGQAVVDAARAVGRGAASVGRGAAGAANWLLRPLENEGRALGRELASAQASIFGNPTTRRLALGTLAGAPTLMAALHAASQKRQDELMALEEDPMRGFHKLSLDSFLEKKAADWRQALGYNAWRADTLPGVSMTTQHSLVKGLGEGLGMGVANLIFGSVGGGVNALRESFIVDPKRKQLFESVVRTDPVIKDALERNPSAAQTLGEAYGTMVRFAPSLALDVNAVRSFLREAVVGGVAGVNYATIKSLIETERALHPHQGGGSR